jgi:uncharacterized repeat protein (TIGR01451 family)
VRPLAIAAAALVLALGVVVPLSTLATSATSVLGDGKETMQSVPAVSGSVDLDVDKEVSSPVLAGEPVTYTIDVQNYGPGDATGVDVSDDVAPMADPTIVSAEVDGEDVSASCGVASTTVSCSDLSIPRDKALGLIISAVVPLDQAGKEITNTAQVDAVDQEDSNPDNNSATIVFLVAAAEVAVAKVGYPTEVTPPGPITWTITVAVNDFGSPAWGVVIADTVDPNQTIIWARLLGPSAARYDCSQTGWDNFWIHGWTAECALDDGSGISTRVNPGDAVVAEVVTVVNAPAPYCEDGVEVICCGGDNIKRDLAQLNCQPAAAVGGIAELPDAASTALETGDSSGSNWGFPAAIAAAAMAGLVAVGSAAWYARRRRLR